ncbi:MAG: helix-hairpin-helix domain-containing protein [Gemmatimonadetes bacterium]|nr:helix-hairpin-helix domain-containing protein [Gemmatimonadota bacterium]
MPTPSEQKALAFVAIVVLLGGAVRAVRASAPPVPTPLEQQALARQATAAESAAATQKGTKRRGVRLARPKRGAAPREVGGVIGYPLGAPLDRSDGALGANGAAPPVPRIDTDARGNRSVQEMTVRGERGARENGASHPVDLDHASEREIEALPRVGPALAHRIVAHRDSFGPFSSMDALKRVKGVGIATARQLAPLVTFSGRPSSPP